MLAGLRPDHLHYTRPAARLQTGNPFSHAARANQCSKGEGVAGEDFPEMRWAAERTWSVGLTKICSQLDNSN